MFYTVKTTAIPYIFWDLKDMGLIHHSHAWINPFKETKQFCNIVNRLTLVNCSYKSSTRANFMTFTYPLDSRGER